jgi:hypothetical protein
MWGRAESNQRPERRVPWEEAHNLAPESKCCGKKESLYNQELNNFVQKLNKITNRNYVIMQIILEWFGVFLNYRQMSLLMGNIEFSSPPPRALLSTVRKSDFCWGEASKMRVTWIFVDEIPALPIRRLDCVWLNVCRSDWTLPSSWRSQSSKRDVSL